MGSVGGWAFYNSAAYALATLLAYKDHRSPFHPEQTRERLGFIRDQATPHIGWTYAADSDVIDLLHQWYIANALMDAFGTTPVSGITSDIIGQFVGPLGFLDALVFAGPQESNGERNALYFNRLAGENPVLLKPAVARLWSLGEMMLGISKIASEDKENLIWRRYADFVVQQLLARLGQAGGVENTYPRHLTHAAHGLAAFLAYRRGFPAL